MRSRRVWLAIAIAVLLPAAVVVAYFEPTQTVPGRLAGEPFYRGRPVRYWREILREHGRDGKIPKTTFDDFHDTDGAFLVLRECALDADRDVRWTAVLLFGQEGMPSKQDLEVLEGALNDSDPQVRLQAIFVLTKWGPRARSAIPALNSRRDDQLEVAHHADLALWRIDPLEAASVCQWRRFTSAEYGFSVLFPEKPRTEEMPVGDGASVAHKFVASHRVGQRKSPINYLVMTLDITGTNLRKVPQADRSRAMWQAAPFFLGGQVVEEKTVSQGGLSGREYVVEFENKGRSRSRQFWDGEQYYAVMVLYSEITNPAAARFFLDSFRVEDKARAEKRPRPDDG